MSKVKLAEQAPRKPAHFRCMARSGLSFSPMSSKMCIGELKAFAPLLLAHGLLTLGFLLAGHFQWFGTWVSPQGYARFASDSMACHWQAMTLKDHLSHGAFQAWWALDSRFHTRCASLCYLLWGKWTGMGILSYWPVNIAFFWMTWRAWRRLVEHLNPTVRPSVFILLCLPSLIVHSTQLLRDPLYQCLGLMWLNAWISLYKSTERTSTWWAFLKILLISPLLFWVRERFWVLAQLASLTWLVVFSLLALTKKMPWRVVKLGLLLCLCINAYSINKMVCRILQLEPEQSQMEQREELKGKPFVFFYKIAALRESFISSYSQASSLDHDVHFSNDGDVIRYLPRAFQIAFFMPFPNMWWEASGKTGLGGRLLSAVEMLMMWSLLAYVVIFSWKKFFQPTYLLVISFVLIQFCALGLVVTNGGALYRMRYFCWLMLLAMVVAAKRSQAKNT